MIFLAPTHAAKKNGKEAIGSDNNIEYGTIHSYLYSFSKKEIDPYKTQRLDDIEYVSDTSNSESDSDTELNLDTSEKEGELEHCDYYTTNKLQEILNEGNIKYIIIDEMSMINLKQFHKLIRTYYNYCYHKSESNIHLVLIGDKNQLTSIGIGEPFVNLQQYIPTFKLTKNFRSKKGIINHCKIILNKDKRLNKYWTFNNTKNTICNKFEEVICLFNSDWEYELQNLLIKLKNEGKIPSDNVKKNNNYFQCITFKNDICKQVCPIIKKIFYNIDTNKTYDKNDNIVIQKNVNNLFYNNDMGKIINIENKYIYKIQLYEPFNIKKCNIKRDEKTGRQYINDNNNNFRIYIEDNNIVYLNENYFKPNYCRTVVRLKDYSIQL